MDKFPILAGGPRAGGGNLVICFAARAMAYSATTVLPADVCAATNTESPFSR